MRKASCLANKLIAFFLCGALLLLSPGLDAYAAVPRIVQGQVDVPVSGAADARGVMSAVPGSMPELLPADALGRDTQIHTSLPLAETKVQAASPFTYSPEKISAALADVPGIRVQILRMMQDPQVPRATKRLIRDSIEKHRVKITHLTDSLLKEFNLGSAEACAVSNPSFGFFRASQATPSLSKKDAYAEPPPTLNNKAESTSIDKILDTINRHHDAIFVQDRPIDNTYNDVFSLIHELAHIKFKDFMNRNIGRLARRFSPDWIRKETGGASEIEETVFLYLTERFAHEYPVAGLRATAGRYFPLLDCYGGRIGPDYRTLLAIDVMLCYRIWNPKIIQLGGRPLNRIFLSGKVPDPSISKLLEYSEHPSTKSKLRLWWRSLFVPK